MVAGSSPARVAKRKQEREKKMANQTVSIPEELKHFFSFVPENAVLFGGAIRDLISGEKEVKDIDLLFETKEEINNFINELKKSKKVSYVSVGRPENYYSKSIYRYKVYFESFGKDYEIDCILAKSTECAFLSDYDVNSLYGKVNKDNVEILGSITSDNVNNVIGHIKNKVAEARFLKGTKFNVVNYRKNKLSRKDFFIEKTQYFYGDVFLSSKEIFEIFQAVKNEVSESSKTETNNSNKGNKKMTNSNKSFSEFFTSNLVEGAYAGAAASTIDNLAKGLLIAMKKAGLDEASLMMAEMMMNHPMGKAALAMMVGSGIELLPIEAVQNNPHIKKIGEKCIQNAGSEGVQFAFEGAMKYVLPALMSAIQSTPQLSLLEQVNSGEKLRVSTSASPSKEDDIPDLNETNPILNMLKNVKQSA